MKAAGWVAQEEGEEGTLFLRGLWQEAVEGVLPQAGGGWVLWRANLGWEKPSQGKKAGKGEWSEHALCARALSTGWVTQEAKQNHHQVSVSTAGRTGMDTSLFLGPALGSRVPPGSPAAPDCPPGVPLEGQVPRAHVVKF